MRKLIRSEIWKDIPEYEGLYQASNQGRVKSILRDNSYGRRLKGKILNPGLADKYGHLCVALCKDGKQKTYFVHRLILETFVGLCPLGMQCRHLDGNGSNNNLENLKWGTAKEDAADRKRHGTFKTGISHGEKHGMAKLTKKEVLEIRKLYKIRLPSGKRKYTQQELADKFNVDQTLISLVVNLKIWVHI